MKNKYWVRIRNGEIDGFLPHYFGPQCACGFYLIETDENSRKCEDCNRIYIKHPSGFWMEKGINADKDNRTKR